MRHNWGIKLLLISPAFIVLSMLLIGGLSIGLLQSLGYIPAIGKMEFTVDAYRTIFSQQGFLYSLSFTFFVTTITTIFSVVGGIITALFLRRLLWGRKIVLLVYQIPISVPHIVVAIGMLTLISQSGMIARLFHAIGFIQEPAQFPIFTHDDLGIGIILTYIWKQIPFIGLITLATLRSLGNNYEEVARTLGATKFQVIRYVLLPLVLPGVLPASLIIFAFVFGAFEVPLLLGQSYPTMLSVIAYRLYTNSDITLRATAMAVNIVIAVVVFILISVYRVMAKTAIKRDV